MNPTVVKLAVRAGLGVLTSVLIGSLVKTEKEANAAIDKHYNPPTPPPPPPVKE
jgi:hypothetical protein